MSTYILFIFYRIYLIQQKKTINKNVHRYLILEKK